MSAGKTDIWMPVYIGNYLADTMHLSTEQHGGYLLLPFHLWRRGILPDGDVVLAQVTGLSISAWSTARTVLGEFFEIRDGLWHHGRVERERSRVAAKQTSNSNKAKSAAYGRWGKPGLPSTASDAAGDACSIRSSNASGTAPAMPDDAKPDSEPELLRAFPSSGRAREKRAADARHTRFRAILAEYWSYKNHASPARGNGEGRQPRGHRSPCMQPDRDRCEDVGASLCAGGEDLHLLAEPGADTGTCRMVGGDILSSRDGATLQETRARGRRNASRANGSAVTGRQFGKPGKHMREESNGGCCLHGFTSCFGQEGLLPSSPVTEDVVRNAMRTVKEQIYWTGTIYQSSSDPVSTPKKRNLGGAIVLAAIGDYCCMDEQAHKDAEAFLYPKTSEQQEHYDWAVALADGVNPAWLRDALDRFKAKWDWQRFERKALSARRA